MSGKLSFKAIVLCLCLVVVLSSLPLSWCVWCKTLDEEAPYIEFKDVNQGDSVYIHTGEMSLLVDGGPSNEGFVFLPNNFCPLTAVLLTHPHNDHLFGLNRVLKLCSPSVTYSNPVKYDSKSYLEYKSLLKGLKKETLYMGDSFNLGSIDFYVLWPPKDQSVSSDINDSSIVLLLDYGSFEALLTGDISAEVQRKLNLSPYSGLIERGIDVYKVPHHGSKHSFDSEYLLLLQPKIAVVSVGENSFGHPSSLFVDFFNEQNIPMYRTDTMGDIRITLQESL